MTKESSYPKIYLAIDNCFAIKRWVKPKDWMQTIKEIGNIKFIEASTDNEIDPLFNTQEFRDNWVDEVKKYEKEYGLKVASFYSGYATYRTAGLTSHAKSSREALKNNYFKNVVDIAAKLNAQVGNALNAFSEPVLDDPDMFSEAEGFLEENLVEMTKYAAEKNVLFGYEQMYTPNQGFWTIDQCTNWMKKVYDKAKKPIYITIDTAHQVGQNAFLSPSDKELKSMVENGDAKGYRLSREIKEMIVSKKFSLNSIKKELEKYHYLFSKPQDSDVFEWFSKLGCYSPLVHLQQTDGTFSGHKPFTTQHNENGIVDPQKIFEAIAKSYDCQAESGMPPKVKEIYLTFEVFFGIMDSPSSIIEAMRESVEHWRKHIPKDGMQLNELI